MVSSKALERKLRSEEICKFESVPFVSHLPVIEDDDEGFIKFDERREPDDNLLDIHLRYYLFWS